jgi:hypothetical protein
MAWTPAGTLDSYIRSFTADKVPLLKLSWPCFPGRAQLCYSVIWHIPKSMVVVEIASNKTSLPPSTWLHQTTPVRPSASPFDPLIRLLVIFVEANTLVLSVACENVSGISSRPHHSQPAISLFPCTIHAPRWMSYDPPTQATLRPYTAQDYSPRVITMTRLKRDAAPMQWQSCDTRVSWRIGGVMSSESTR